MILELGVEVEILSRPEPTGVERALRLWLEELGRSPDFRVTAFSRTGGIELPGGVARVEVPSRLPLALWREMRLPRAIDRAGVKLFLSPVTAFPLRSPVPAAATIHELPWLEEGLGGTPRQQRLRARTALARAALVIAVSEATARRCRELAAAAGLAPPPLAVVPHPFPLPEAGAPDPPTQERPPLAVTVAAWRPRKNLPAHLEAFATTLARVPRARYVIVGTGGRGHRLLARRVRAAGLAGKVLLPGRLSDGEIGRLLGRARVLFHAPLSEGFGFTPLEALARGCVPLLSRRGALPEINGSAALYLEDPTDPAAMGRALAAALADGEARRACLAAAPRVLAARAPKRALARLRTALTGTLAGGTK